MRGWFARIAAIAVAVLSLAGIVVQANERPGFKGPNEDGTMPALVKVAGEGLMQSHAYEYLEELADDVGGRVTGSPADKKAQAWGVAKMKVIGLENVHTEGFQIWRGWTRGTAEAELLAPVRHKLHVDAMGWTGSTAASGAEGDIVPVNISAIDKEIKNISRLKGKVALMVKMGQPNRESQPLFARFGDFLRAAGPAGVIAVIGGQGGSKAAGVNLTHTGILGFDADYTVPVVSMTGEDQDQLERFLERGIIPRARFKVQNTFTDGPVDSANVIGEIRGREKPEQILVVGGHLDSWDLAQGATDNGSGTAAVLGAAEAILRSGQRPRRTIRFVLFTGEEQGFDGSFAYVKQHQSEMANHLGNLVLDGGQAPVKGFLMGGRDDLVAAIQPFADALSNFRELKVDDKLDPGTDTLPFSIEGLPGISMDQDGAEYRLTHHSAADALEAQQPDVLAQNATLMALTAFWIADRPDRFATPWPRERTAKMLRTQNEYEELKAFKKWPFGDLGAEGKE